MGVTIFYLMALVFSVICILCFLFSKRVNLLEAIAGIGISFAMAGLIHVIALAGLTGDIETWSGRVVQLVHEPEWVEEYEVAIYRTEMYSCGDSMCSRQVFSHYETRYRTHGPYWKAYANYGAKDDVYHISQERYNRFRGFWGGTEQSTPGSRSGYYSGDKNDYHVIDNTGYIIPTTIIVDFENRIKACPSIHSFMDIPEDIEVYPYPENDDRFLSDRLVGEALNHIQLRPFDTMNSILGPTKFVNVIFVGFPQGSSPIMGQYQEAEYVGGKKNDLVVTYTKGEDGTAEWVYVFGWTDKEIVKQNLQTIFLDNQIDDSILPLVQAEVIENYVIKEWDDFNYLTIEPPEWSYLVMIIVLVVVVGGFLIYSFLNEYDGAGLFGKNRSRW